MLNIADNLRRIKEEIVDTALRYGRLPEEIKLVAVSKNFNSEFILKAYNCGQKVFGENKVQELCTKSIELSELQIEWHMIGHIQSNKLKKALNHSSFIHSIDSFELLKKAENILQVLNKKVDFLLELNLSGEESKFGICNKDELFKICESIPEFKFMNFKGLMTMAPFTENEIVQRKVFAGLRELRDEIQEKFGFTSLELSMGMSSDYKSAIAEGATILRIGTAIFGERK
ncbi:MAG TPA: YggS family pyridoxal phosphate-dependent enzyme [Victivallales bacterium]|nr:YggS family pyridoxal phosphate-dependent enzyme [Victivallales bacterium]HPO91038.1 YggS family pyridoxal phosphate-dependent enzyme [Victivallales bacterium]HRU00227.1 YggS family pyridoxal phosphate-dependent enzyme [Victivallales bacterium]